MATVIDELIVRLGLDPRNFTKGQKQAAAELAKTRAELRKLGQEGQQELDKIGEAIGGLRRGALAFTSALLGAGGLITFATKITQVDAALGRFTRSTGENAERVSIWGNTIQRMGGDAGAFQNTLGGLIGQFEQFAATGQSSLIPFLRGLGVQLTTDTGKMRSFEDVLLDLTKRVSSMRPAQAQWWLRSMGIDDGTINAMLKGEAALRRMLREQEKVQAVSKEQTDRAEALASAWDTAAQSAINLGRHVLNGLTPHMVTALEATQNWIAKSKVAFDQLLKWVESGTWEQTWDSFKSRAADEWGKFLQSIKDRSLIQIVPGSPLDKLFKHEQAQRELAEQQRKGGATLPHPTRGAPVKPGAGTMSPGVRQLADDIFQNVPGLSRVTSAQDAFHANRPGSAHNDGRAFDFTVKDPSKSAEAAAAVRAYLREKGIDAYVQDEYKNRSPGSTGGHIHLHFRNKDDAAAYGAGGWPRVLPTPAPAGAGVSPGGGPTTNDNRQSSATQITIQNVAINTQATDADGIARDLVGAVRRQAMVAHAQSGMA